MIKIEELRVKLKELGYFATEELIYDAFNALCMFNDGKVNSGQDIYAICLEGPPGAGKTEFAKTYTKISNMIFNGNVEMVDYQCDATTGKTELFEDINISAAIRGDADNVNIPGKLVEAINKVNSGKKVVLFIDEYDKAREETDAFLLQFLQSGKINSTQHGDLEVKEEYKANLQVILCKNDMREELSGPLSRRIRIIRLDYMEPNTFYQVAHRVLIENRFDKINDGLLNLVSLMYQKAYEQREIYDRLPSCSEMLTAIEDADRLVKKANAPQYIVYNILIKNMFKVPDDIKTFESSLENVKKEDDSALSAVVKGMKVTQQQEKEIPLNSLIAQNVFNDESTRLAEKTEQMEKLIEEYKVKFNDIEEKRKQTIKQEVEKILLENGKLVSNTAIPNVIRNFEDESAFVKRGYNIFELSEQDWVDVGEIFMRYLSHHDLIDKLIENASDLGVKVYENGILLREDENQKLIVISDLDKYHQTRYRILANEPVIPSTYISDIMAFIKFIKQIHENSELKIAERIADEVTGMINNKYTLNTLIYNDSEIEYEVEEPNVYHIELAEDVNSIPKLEELVTNLSCSDINNAAVVSKKIMDGKGKTIK